MTTPREPGRLTDREATRQALEKLRSDQERLEGRVSKLEDLSTTAAQWRQDLAVREARREEQTKHIDERFDRIEKDMREGFTRFEGTLNRFGNNFTWAARIALGAVILSVVGFLIKGGFYVG